MVPSPRAPSLIADLKALGLQLATATPTAPTTGQSLTGKRFVITGTLPTLTREAAKTLIQQHGGQVSESVSRQTDYLVVGEKAGSKLQRAQELGIPCINETELIEMCR